jgi:hypothetical protein
MQKRSSHVWDERFFVCSKIYPHPGPNAPSGYSTVREEEERRKKMNTQAETKLVVKVAETALETENPMQERYCGQVTESVEMAAEAVFAARRLEAQEEAGPVFVP